jgi:hypothetical protein
MFHRNLGLDTAHTRSQERYKRSYALLREAIVVEMGNEEVQDCYIQASAWMVLD